MRSTNYTTLGRVKENFKRVRENALANPYLYNLRYIQRNRKDAYIEYLEQIVANSVKLPSCGEPVSSDTN